MSLMFLLALPFLGSALAAVLPTNARTTAASGAALVAFVALLQVLMLMPDIQNGRIIEEQLRWLPAIGLNFSVRMDGFAWMFAVLVTGIGMLVALYARYYMSKDDPVPRFFSFFLAFMGAMLGVVLSGNIIQLVFFWELTSLFSFLLIGYWHHRKDARRGARMALTVTGMGGLCLLAGALLLGHIVGSYELGVVLAAAEVVHAHPLYVPMLVLVLMGALTKSAQFPFHFWLPRAMAAPTPVSAYLHSATMVKAGVFLLARLWPVLAGTPEWFWIVSTCGLITLVLGAYIANFQNDLKGLLAYSTISHLGLITLLLGLNSPMAAVAAVFHIINHATFKASLFMAAGIIDHETGTRDIRRLSGLFKTMPITSSLAILASAAMAGVPLFNGFLSKEMFFAETVYFHSYRWVELSLPFLATVAAVFATAYSLRFTVDVFFGPAATDLPREPHEPVRWMRVPVEALVIICLLVGVLPGTVIAPILTMAATPVVGGTLPPFELSIWHGVNAPLIMSLIALIGGFILYMLLRKGLKQGHFNGTPLLNWANGQTTFEYVVGFFSNGSRKLQQVFYTRRLQPQIFLLIVVSIATMGASLWHSGFGWGDRPRVPATWEFMLVWLVGCICALAAANQAKFHRLAALILLGGAGLSTCLTFIWFSAPDLALTQLAVEVVTTILFLLGLRWLPKRFQLSTPQMQLRASLRRSRDFVLAGGVGVGLAVLAYALMTRSAPQSIAPFYLERALPEGGGTNVVNVMLVDFRAFDTMGEIVVLGAVSLTVFALLRRFRPPQEAMAAPHQQRSLPADLDTDLVNPRTAPDTAIGYLMVPAVLARVMLPVMALFALHLFIRGHNEPGGGFVAGLLVAIGFITQYIVAGTHWVEAHINLYLRRWVAVGIMIVIATGLGSLWFGYPLLTTHTAHIHLPLIGEIHLASAMFFDMGVFAVVVGSTLLTLTALAHQSVRRQRKGSTAGAAPSPAELAQKEGILRAPTPTAEGAD